MFDPELIDSAEAGGDDLLRHMGQPLHERLAQDLGRILVALRLVSRREREGGRPCSSPS